MEGEINIYIHFPLSRYPVSSAPSVEEAVCSPVCIFGFFVNNRLAVAFVNLYLGPLFYSIDPHVCFCAITMLFL